jgi:hypothetical protein
MINPWQLMFLQSKANANPYNGDRLAIQNWKWPKATWFQERLTHLRKTARRPLRDTDGRPGAISAPRWKDNTSRGAAL